MMNQLSVLLLLALLNYASSQTVQGCSRDKVCYCAISGNWSSLQQYRELQQVKQHIATLNRTMTTYNIPLILTAIKNITIRLSNLNRTMLNQSVAVSMKELQELRERTAALLRMVQASGNIEKRSGLGSLLRNLTALKAQIDDLWNRNPLALNVGFGNQLEKLRARLKELQEQLSWPGFRGERLGLGLNYTSWCRENELESIGPAFTHRYRTYTLGGWFKDPYPVTSAARSEVFTRSYGYQYVERFTNYSSFVAGRPLSYVASRTNAYGLGYIVYNGSFYWNYGAYIYRRDLRTGAQKIARIYIRCINYRSIGYYSYVDFMADEFGLWLVAPTRTSNYLAVTKLDPDTLRLGTSYSTSINKASVCGAFMVCGKLYTITNCNNPVPPPSSRRQSVYDILTRRQSLKYLSLTTKYGMIYSMKYNPRERLLFTYDRNQLVTHKINWKKRNTP